MNNAQPEDSLVIAALHHGISIPTEPRLDSPQWLAFIQHSSSPSAATTTMSIVKTLAAARKRWSAAAPIAEGQRRSAALFGVVRKTDGASFRRFLAQNDVASFSTVDTGTALAARRRRRLARAALQASTRTTRTTMVTATTRSSIDRVAAFLSARDRQRFCCCGRGAFRAVRRAVETDASAAVALAAAREVQCIAECGFASLDAVDDAATAAVAGLQEKLKEDRRGARLFHSAEELSKWGGPLDELQLSGSGSNGIGGGGGAFGSFLCTDIAAVGRLRASNVPPALLEVASCLLLCWRRPCVCPACSSSSNSSSGGGGGSGGINDNDNDGSGDDDDEGDLAPPSCPFFWNHFLQVFRAPTWERMRRHLDFESPLTTTAVAAAAAAAAAATDAAAATTGAVKATPAAFAATVEQQQQQQQSPPALAAQLQRPQPMLLSLCAAQWRGLERRLTRRPLLQPTPDLLRTSRFAYFATLWLRAHVAQYQSTAAAEAAEMAAAVAQAEAEAEAAAAIGAPPPPSAVSLLGDSGGHRHRRQRRRPSPLVQAELLQWRRARWRSGRHLAMVSAIECDPSDPAKPIRLRPTVASGKKKGHPKARRHLAKVHRLVQFSKVRGLE